MPFTKGDPNINRDGRPLGSISLKTEIKRYFRDNPDKFQEYMHECLEDKAMRKVIFEQIDGKPLQQTDITSQGEKIVFIPSEIASKNNISTKDDA